MLKEAQQRMEQKLTDWGFAPQPKEKPHDDTVFKFKDTEQTIALPVMDVLEDNIMDAAQAFKDAKKIVAQQESLEKLNVVAPVLQEFEQRFGYKSERKKPTDQAKLMPPRDAAGQHFNLVKQVNIIVPDEKNPTGVDDFITKTNALRTDLEKLISRKDKIVIVAAEKGFSTVQQEDGKFRLTFPADKGGETREYNTYGSAQILSSDDLGKIERALDIREEKAANRKR